MTDLIPNEMCESSQNDFGTHCEHWYEDEGCCYCGTKEPNLVVLEGQ